MLAYNLINSIYQNIFFFKILPINYNKDDSKDGNKDQNLTTTTSNSSNQSGNSSGIVRMMALKTVAQFRDLQESLLDAIEKDRLQQNATITTTTESDLDAITTVQSLSLHKNHNNNNNMDSDRLETLR